MNKVVILISIFLFGQLYSQKTTEKMLADIDRISLENPDSALVLIDKIEPHINDAHFKSKLLLSKGNAISLKHLSSQSLNYGFEAFEISSKARDSIMMINSLCFIGNQYYIIKLNMEALNYLTKAEKLIDHISTTENTNYINANIYFVKGLIYKDNLDPNFALEYFNKAISIYYKEKNNSAFYNMFITQIQKAYTLGDVNKIDDAKKLLNQIIISSEKKKLNEIGNYAKIALATLDTKAGDYEMSNQILLQVQKRIDKNENSLMLLEINEAITNNYFLLKDFENYKIYSGKYVKSLLENDSKEAKSLSDISRSNFTLSDEKHKENTSSFLIFIVVLAIIYTAIFYILLKNILLLKNNVLLLKDVSIL